LSTVDRAAAAAAAASATTLGRKFFDPTSASGERATFCAARPAASEMKPLATKNKKMNWADDGTKRGGREVVARHCARWRCSFGCRRDTFLTQGLF